MGMEQLSFDALCDIRAKFSSPEVTLLSLGYPDLLVPEADLRSRLGDGFIQPARDAEKIARWHSWSAVIYDTDDVLKQLGIKATYIDIRPSRGVEQIVDLNNPWKEFYETFDIVFDGGTLEHCFNIGQAFKYVARSVKIGGYVIHTNPVTQINHGFWNLCPTSYLDFYTQNGFEVLRLDGVHGRPDIARHETMQTTQRIELRPEVRSLVVARKWGEVPLKWPTQSKYLSNPDLKA